MGLHQINIQNSLEEEQLIWLKNEWDLLASQTGIPVDKSEKIRLSIFKRYNSTSRTYHNLNHIYSFLKTSEIHQSNINNTMVFNWSVWFHDLVYVPMRKDNEMRSADLAVKLLSPYLEESDLSRVEQLILSTVNHKTIDDKFESALFLDADLAILAAPKNVYRQYSQKIRKEFWMIPLFIYRRGRAKVLNHFQEKKKIYLTDYFYDQYESIARENLKWELESLG